MPHPLFIYGTLHPSRAPAEIAPTVALLKSLGRASLRGRLLDLGAYPGLLLPRPNELADPIPGELFALPDGSPQVLAALDAYEDFRPAAPAASLFLRVLTSVTLPDGSLTRAWVYLYNQRETRAEPQSENLTNRSSADPGSSPEGKGGV